MALELTIGADVQPAITALKDMKDSLKSLQDQLKKTTDPTEYNKLTKAIVDQKNQIQQAEAATKGFANSTFGVSRAARVAHNDLDQTVRSIESLSRGSSGAADGVSGLIFTFERLKGVTGSTSSALGAIGDALLSPAGLVLALGAGIPLIIEAGAKFVEMANGSRQAKEEIDALTASLKKSKELLGDYNTDIDKAAVLRKLKIDIQTPQGTERSIKDLGVDLDAAKTKIINTGAAIETYQSGLERLEASTKKISAEQDKLHFGSLQFERNKVALEKNEKEINLFKDQIKDAQKVLEDAKFDVEAIPLKIKLIETDKAREDAEKAAKKVVSDIKVTEGLITVTNLKILPENVKVDIEKVRGASQALQEALFKGFSPEEKAKEFKKLNDQLNNASSFGELLKVKVDLGDFEKAHGVAIGALGGIKKEVATTAALVDSVLTPAFENMFSAIESGGNALKAFLKGIEQAISQLITKLIIAAAEAAVLSLLSGGSTSFLSAFKGLLKIPHLAEGGIVGAGTLAVVGEAGPEVIMPLDRLKGLLGGLAGNNINVGGDFRLSGNDLVLAVNRTNRTQGRSF